MSQSTAPHQQRTSPQPPPHMQSITRIPLEGGVDSDKQMKNRQRGRRKNNDYVWYQDGERNVPGNAPCTSLIHLDFCLFLSALVEELLKTPVMRVAGASWSSWETWSSCSQSCAKGYRTRRRSCTGPEGKSAPVACRGSPVEYQDCNVQPCPGEWIRSGSLQSPKGLH